MCRGMQTFEEVTDFMTEEGQDAIIGRVVREYAATSKKLAALQSEARSAGNDMRNLGRVLEASPEHITFNGGPMEIRFEPRVDFDAKRLNLERISELCAEIRTLTIELDKLAEEKRRLGV
jgi:hypothetical protein